MIIHISVALRVLHGLIWLVCGWCIAKLLSLISRSKIWLVCERSDEARDNGYHLFRYIRTCHPSVRAYYVIERRSPDRERIASYGQVITWGSFRHWLYWCLAECVVSTHPGGCAPDPRIGWRVKKFGLVNHAAANIKHGIIAVSVPDYYIHPGSSQPNLIACASNRELTFLNAIGDYGNDVLQILGLCRFDALHEPVEMRRQVLLMPTWRRWFRGLIQQHGREEALRVFKDSDYFKVFHAFLQSERLHRILEEEDYCLVFYPHYGVQEYLEAFGKTHGHIIIADRREYDVQRLMKESAVLVTDFSSVAFDFAYMNKPLVYILPDEERYFSEHFQRGYFDFDQDGFGPVTRDPESAIEAVANILKQGAVQEKIYKERVEDFFPLRDNRNCERTFLAIQKIVAQYERGHERR